MHGDGNHGGESVVVGIEGGYGEAVSAYGEKANAGDAPRSVNSKMDGVVNPVVINT